ncbi:hypothetical protein [Brevibacterium sp. SIMBA_078]|uniref:hypothetical protein n=1 Tax=unclassified Brevibacterium TaxID=2614124 RepID=UPI0039793986
MRRDPYAEQDIRADQQPPENGVRPHAEEPLAEEYDPRVGQRGTQDPYARGDRRVDPLDDGGDPEAPRH